MNGWRVAALLSILAFVALACYTFHLVSRQRDPLDVLEMRLRDPALAVKFVEKGDPSLYLELGMIGDMARRGDSNALKALISVSGFMGSGRDRDFLSYWFARIAASQPELFLAACSRMGKDAAGTVEMLARGVAYYGKEEFELRAVGALMQAARDIDSTSRWIREEVKKARRVESRQEVEEDPGGSG